MWDMAYLICLIKLSNNNEEKNRFFVSDYLNNFETKLRSLLVVQRTSKSVMTRRIYLLLSVCQCDSFHAGKFRVHIGLWTKFAFYLEQKINVICKFSERHQVLF